MIYLLACGVHACFVPHSALRADSCSTRVTSHSFNATLEAHNMACGFRGMINSLLSAITLCICFGLFLEATDLAVKKNIHQAVYPG